MQWDCPERTRTPLSLGPKSLSTHKQNSPSIVELIAKIVLLRPWTNELHFWYIQVSIFIAMTSEHNLKYQEAMHKLEAILKRVDDTNVGIDELASQVQEATELLKTCRRILTETEQSVRVALDSLDGEFKEKDNG